MQSLSTHLGCNARIGGCLGFIWSESVYRHGTASAVSFDSLCTGSLVIEFVIYFLFFESLFFIPRNFLVTLVVVRSCSCHSGLVQMSTPLALSEASEYRMRLSRQIRLLRLMFQSWVRAPQLVENQLFRLVDLSSQILHLSLTCGYAFCAVWRN